MNTNKHAAGLPAVILTLVVVLFTGCANTPPPKEQLAAGNLAVKQADEAGARRFAALEFHAAEKKLQKAQAAMQDKDYDLARRFAEQAEVDAELAQNKARSAKAHIALKELRETIRTLRDELNRADQS